MGALWAPGIVEKDGKFYLFFGGNDIQNDEQVGGVGVAVADKPSGPFKLRNDVLRGIELIRFGKTRGCNPGVQFSR